MNRFRANCFRRLALWLALGASVATVQGQTNNLPVATAIGTVSTNSYWKPFELDPAIYSTPYRISLFRPISGEDGARTWSQTKSLFFYGLGVFGVLAVMPESMTGWDSQTDIFKKWGDNVTAGPVWDRDNAIYNYAGHTYSGGVYYQVARKSGYRQWDSFVYAFLMSSLYWEYGVEAFAETPSIQDLVVTPVFGWVYGEWAYQTEFKIRNHGNKVAGSKILGETSLFFLDPIDSIGRGVNRVVRRRWIKAGYGYFSYSPDPGGGSTVYLNMRVPLGGSHEPKPEPEIRKINYSNDPVDTGIVGFSGGYGYAFLDDKWGMEDGLFYKFTLGLSFTPRFSTRVAYARGHLDSQAAGAPSQIYENYSLDGQYYFFPEQKLRPYLTAGFGEQMWGESEDDKSLQLNAGLGLHWQVHRKWTLQADWINYFSADGIESYDQTVNATLVYRFGQGEHSDW